MGEVFDRKSVYARNKMNPDAIVCPDATGKNVLIMREAFSSEEEFRYWKNLSDEDYHIRAQGDWRENDHTVSINVLPEQTGFVQSPEDTMFCRIDRLKRGEASAEFVCLLQSILTEKQFRRLWLYSVDGLTQQRIGRLENASQKRISKSIIAAKKRIIKFLLKEKNRG